jgi:hypothetical protein
MMLSIIMYFVLGMTGKYPECSESECQKIVSRSSQCIGRKDTVYYDRKLNLLCIRGAFFSNHILRDEVLKITPRSRPLVVITSDGGFIGDAMDTAQYLEKYKFDVAVNGICASACAQFVFIAGQKKYILGDGAVAMHGGPMSDDLINAMDIDEVSKLNLKNENRRFIEFYKTRKIKLSLVLDAPQRVLDKIKTGKVEFWIPTEQQFYDANVKKLKYCNSKFRDPNHVGKS